MNIPESVILECQRQIYVMFDEASAAKKAAVTAAAQSKKLADTAAYKETICREMIDFLVDNQDEEPEKVKTRADYEEVLKRHLDDAAQDS